MVDDPEQISAGAERPLVSPRIAHAYQRLLLLVGLGGVVIGARELHRFVLSAPELSLARVQVVGAERAGPEAVRNAASLSLGDNVFALDLRRAEERVENLDWIKGARVVLVLPDTVRIEVQEHQPVLLMALGDLYLVNGEGEVFRAYGAGEALEWPILQGVSRRAWEAAEARALDAVNTALAFVRVWHSTHGPERKLESLDVSSGGIVRFSEVGGADTIIGPSPWEGVLREVDAAMRQARTSGHKVKVARVGRGRRRGWVSIEGAKNDVPRRPSGSAHE